jgi:hypothetical protein
MGVPANTVGNASPSPKSLSSKKQEERDFELFHRLLLTTLAEDKSRFA